MHNWNTVLPSILYVARTLLGAGDHGRVDPHHWRISNIFRISPKVINLIKMVGFASEDRQNLLFEIVPSTRPVLILVEYPKIGADLLAKTFIPCAKAMTDQYSIFKSALSTSSGSLHMNGRAFLTAYPMLAGQGWPKECELYIGSYNPNGL